ncbi:MAG: BirA family transcriptional regulator [Campylobacterota bacterium]|nr:BirA family transcriptional regulator [Campylobacterota bacterium]
MEIFYYKEIDSTQLEARRILKSNQQATPFAVVADIQTFGIGSRSNNWDSVDGNLFMSFVLNKKNLPCDLELVSTSIYFGYILKLALKQLGSQAWLKWPNDIYIKENKIGGIMTNIVGENIICGIGLNLLKTEKYASLDIKIERETIVKTYFYILNEVPSWKRIFSMFRVEFDNSKDLKTHVDGQSVSLKNALLESDGSLIIEGKRVYSLR